MNAIPEQTCLGCGVKFQSFDALMDACGPAADDVLDMIEQEIEK